VTSPGQPIDVAFVEIVPDTSLFVTRLRRQTREAFDDLERAAERVAENLEGDLKDAADDAGDAFEKTSDRISDDMQEAADNVEAAFEDVDASSNDMHRRLDQRAEHTADVFDKVGDKISDSVNDAFDDAGDGAKKANKIFSTLGESLVSIGSAIVGLGASAPTPAGLIAIGVVVAALAALTPLILALVAALADLAGLVTVLPAGLAVLAAVIAPLVIGFQGFGDAIGAILEKDPEKIKEALAGLAPAARSVAVEFQKLLPQFERLQDIVQQTLFAQFQGSLTAVANALLPTLTAGLARVADALGDAGAAFAAFLSSAATRNTLAAVFASAETVVRTLTPAVIRLFEVLTSAVAAGLPFVEQLTVAFARLLDNFSAFLAESIKTGAFKDFFDDAIATVRELFDLGKALGGLFVAIFGDLDDAGRSFIGTLTDLVNRMTAFFESSEGKDLLQDLAASIPLIAQAIGFMVNALVFVLDLLGDLDDAAIATKNALVEFFTATGTAISNFVDSVAEFFAALPGKILAALAALPGLINNFFLFLFDQLFIAIGQGLALIIFAFTELPGLLLQALIALPGVLLNIFHTAFTTVTTFVISSLQFLIRVIPELLAQAVEFGRQVIVTGFQRIVEFIRSVPGRIRDAFLAAGSLVIEIGAAIAGALKSVINRAIDRINDGIRSIDDVLPGSLPRIPRLEHGGVATQETLARIGERGRAEGVIPLEDPRALRLIGEAIAGAAGNTGGGALFGPGSIQINFDGVTPTDGEARQVGQFVGEGIAAALTRRGIKLQVRAV
jgi:phage-related protein